MPDYKAGDKVWYVPCVQTHWHDRDHKGDPVFEFVHAEHGPPVAAGQDRLQKGEVVRPGNFALATSDEGRIRAQNLPLGHVESRDEKGVLTTSKGHKLYPRRHVKPWEAVVVRVNEDGSADLEIKHPCGYATLRYPDREAHPDAPGIPYDPKHGFHTFHLPEEAEDK